MKKLVLAGLKRLEYVDTPEDDFLTDDSVFKVRCCAVCRTDAKMWAQGHRDLSLPRVPGHEMVVVDRGGHRFAVWPGKSCGHCRYCRGGRENLCEEMKIMGFHTHGGFAEEVVVPASSLVPLPGELSDPIACFAEPVGCVFNLLDKLGSIRDDRVIIYGGGTMGLVAALVFKDAGAKVLVVEKSEEKRSRIAPFLEATAISCLKDTVESEFDVVVNACADFIAFSLGIVKAGKGSRICFFSGITKNETIESNLLNLIHYKEAVVSGAYGLTRKNMVDGVPFMEKYQHFLELLVEACVSPVAVAGLMQQVVDGKALKYIIDFTGDYLEEFSVLQGGGSGNGSPIDAEKNVVAHGIKNGNYTGAHGQSTSGCVMARSLDSSGGTSEKISGNISTETALPGEGFCRDLIKSISPVDMAMAARVQEKIDNKTKPLGALGTLEQLAFQMSMIQQNLNPCIHRKALFVFAGDHGITEEGVSAYPREVTRQMVKNFLDGGAAINVLCRHHHIDMKIVDMGVDGDFDSHPDLIVKKVRRGTRNFALEPAMTRQEMFTALGHGMSVFLESHDNTPVDIVGVGEMGIGNTTSASAIIATVCGITPAQATGRGTGVDNKGLIHKTEVIEKVLAFQQPNPADGLEILEKVGGYEIAGIAGAVLAAASRECAVVLDGVISTAAGLVACVINPDIRGYLISGHKSVEVAQKSALEYMDITSVIDFKMRLGEGTGAALTMDTAEAACKIMCEMASFDDAGVAGKL
ncbi:nicotinate-nucleotide-dimethylbenzimidazole phosphoribosyltransferase [Desulfocicer vacuolatum DSM 3385]|uniref:Nicotinate-nucleotide--dimethylbenzimidazole phosphoribosyltransferase n=1 Tax=Desulfocicer vacuolatum DSM 3385 TaxID=1121400 RepID=A0A1W1YNV2_9BACT|nr:nicotinate-nucleotide--dimethylbenzimidazole phosphoribosyltransferase [Desulfocicer vacuolatum]SMC37890.1 nicotinate-nucleotide-dimethylbenzimidazole phosphoribosyltransferase [Desulfocicer vacuolatum DSM 3385]